MTVLPVGHRLRCQCLDSMLLDTESCFIAYNWNRVGLLLLLLIGVTFPHLPEVQGKPHSFWCDQIVRDSMVTANGLKTTEDARCVASVTLPSPVLLPCVGVNTTAWENKTLQQKFEEVLADFQGFQKAVEAVKTASANSTQQCQRPLEDLERCIGMHVRIVENLRIQIKTAAPSPPPPAAAAAQHCSTQTSQLSQVVEKYKVLLKGKLNVFAKEVDDYHRRAGLHWCP